MSLTWIHWLTSLLAGCQKPDVDVAATSVICDCDAARSLLSSEDDVSVCETASNRFELHDVSAKQ